MEEMPSQALGGFHSCSRKPNTKVPKFLGSRRILPRIIQELSIPALVIGRRSRRTGSDQPPARDAKMLALTGNPF
jgi:hypothetical protein